MNTNYQYALDAEGNAVITRQLHPIQFPARGKEPIMRYENGRTIQDGIIYDLNKDGTADVCGYRSFHWNVNIPTSVNGYRVVRIREEAFAGCTQIQQVRIPEGVLEIRSDAFQGCNQLAYLYLPKSLSRIGKGAIPNYGIREITDYAQAAYEEELQNDPWSRKMYGLYDPVTPRKTRVYIPNVYVPRDSYAECYCKDNNIRYMLK